ncbi:hypothetical protein GGR57DRAFT_466004 [Xylariaceae sp. FL1272]|nr:hypothetical protein GGR57DRAFT_466004 [Xylariaceae sp. FL1272]
MRVSIVFRAVALVASPGAASYVHSRETSASLSRPDQSCPFAIQASDPFTGYAGQLDDGQIRLNSTYGKSLFYLDEEGGITDSKGSGCIVTDIPITQIQCDAGKKPMIGFSVGATSLLMYKGSPHFWACPATGSDWNIYVDPNFYQTKCKPITLRTTGCLNPGGNGNGTTTTTTSCPTPTTVWTTQVDTVTVVVTQTLPSTLTTTTQGYPVSSNCSTSSLYKTRSDSLYQG